MAKKAHSNRPKAYSYLRMSTKAQLSGDSRRRQLEASKQYAAQHDLDLVTDFKLEDIGFSAYTGDHIRNGRLGVFLKAIKEGKIERGSYLLVESLDRISRLEIFDAQALFMDIRKAGIHIVTMNDGRFYDANNPTLSDMIVSIVDFMRSNLESVDKGIRLSKAWAQKRRNANNTKLTSICPAWLKLHKNRFEINEEIASVVRSIFELSASGLGNFAIAKTLNTSGVQPFGKSDGWHPSYISKILQSRAAIGEFQGYKKSKGQKREPDGEVVDDYFPPIIATELFYRAQDQRRQRKVNGAGRKGPNISNLFSGIVRCAYCSGNMKFENKGPPPKGTNFFVCERAKRSDVCVVARWRYDEFEKSFLAFVRELDLKSLLASHKPENEREILFKSISSLNGEIVEIDKRMDRLAALLEDGSAAHAYLLQRLGSLAEHKERTLETLKAKKSELIDLDSSFSEFYKSQDEIKQTISSLQNVASTETFLRRAEVAAKLKAIVENIFLAAAGSRPFVIEMIEAESRAPRPKRKIVERLTDAVDKSATTQRYFMVEFKDGSRRGVMPSNSDPLKFETQIVRGLGEDVFKEISPDGQHDEFILDEGVTRMANRWLP